MGLELKSIECIRDFIKKCKKTVCFIDIFDIFESKSPKHCVFIDIFDIFDILPSCELAWGLSLGLRAQTIECIRDFTQKC